MKPNAAAFFTSPGTVFEIPFDMKVKGGELGPYLVMTSGNKIDFQEEIAIPPAGDAVTESRLSKLT
jgi:hypothetical protein